MLKYQIIDNINNYVGNDAHKDWYVGIAANVRHRLFEEHNVDEKHDKWIHCPADDESAARETEKELLDDHGYDGGTGGGDHPIYIYAYKKNSRTRE